MSKISMLIELVVMSLFIATLLMWCAILSAQAGTNCTATTYGNTTYIYCY